VGQAPQPARDALVPLLLRIHRLGIEKRPTRGSAADVGVLPTIYADARKWENYAALGLRSRLGKLLQTMELNAEPGAKGTPPASGSWSRSPKRSRSQAAGVIDKPFRAA